MDPSWVMPFETFWDRSFMVIAWWSCGDLMVNGKLYGIMYTSGVIKHSSILSSIYFDVFPLLNLHKKKRWDFPSCVWLLEGMTHGISTSWNYELTEHESHLFINGWYVKTRWTLFGMVNVCTLRPGPNPWRLGACPRTVDAPNNLKVKGLVGRDFKPPWTLCGLMPYHGLYHLYP